MKRTRVRLSGEECMKFSADCSSPLARDRAVSRLRRSCVEAGSRFYMCIVNERKARRAMGICASCRVLVRASRYASLLAPSAIVLADHAHCCAHLCWVDRRK